MVSALRNRHAVPGILAVALAVSFGSGAVSAVDSSAQAVLSYLLDGMPADLEYSASSDNASAILQAVRQVEGVTDATAYRRLPAQQLWEPKEQVWVNVLALGVLPGNLPAQIRGWSATGPLDLPRGTIGLAASVAGELGVRPTDNVFLAYTAYDPSSGVSTTTTLNLTVSVLLAPNPATGAYSSGTDPYLPVGVINISDFSWAWDQLEVPGDPYAVQGDLWVDRNLFLEPYDIESTQANLRRLDGRVRTALAPFRGDVRNNLVDVVSSLANTLASLRLTFLVLSTPTILLGLFVGYAGVQLGHLPRRREFAILRARGANRQQVTARLVGEALVAGGLAGMIGWLMGIGLSRLVLAFVSPFGARSSSALQEVSVSAEAILAALVLGILLTMIASYLMARRSAQLPIVDTLHSAPPRLPTLGYRPKLDIVLVILGASCFLVVSYGLSSPNNLVTLTIGPGFLSLAPVAPFLLILGATRLATQVSSKPFVWSAHIFKPLTTDVHELVVRNLGRYPLRSANVSAIVALGVAFGFFAFSFLGSQIAYEQRLLRADIAGDISVVGPTVYNSTLLDRLGSLPGVSRVTPFITLPVGTSVCCPTTWALEPESYFDVTQPEGWYFEQGGTAEARSILAERGQVILSRAFADDAGLALGDRITFSGSEIDEVTGNLTETFLNVTVGGFVRGLPGSFRFGPGPPLGIYASIGTLSLFLPADGMLSFAEFRYFVDLLPGVDDTAIGEAILALGVREVRVLADEMERLSNEPVQGATVGILKMEAIFMGALLAVGISLLVYTASLERQTELATILARGADRLQLASMLLGEAGAVVIVGLAVGSGIGLLSSVLFTRLLLVPPGIFQLLVPIPLVFPAELLVLPIVVAASAAGASGLVSLRAHGGNLARVLRLRGG